MIQTAIVEGACEAIHPQHGTVMDEMERLNLIVQTGGTP
jgi:hypothetical protein